jgi:hypothetical protein
MPNNASLNLKIPCGRCHGTKVIDSQKDADGNPLPNIPCVSCDSTGEVLSGKISGNDLDKILRQLKKIMNKLDIEDD